MKLATAALLLVLSTQAFSASFGLSTFLTSGNICKEARETINDAQDFMQSGLLSVALAQKIEDVKKSNADLSTEEALELLVEKAEKDLVENAQ